MKITTTPFHFDHHYSESAGNSINGYYIYHCATAYNSIFIDDKEFNAVYETGEIHYCYKSPSNTLTLSDWGTHELLFLIDSIYHCNFENDLKDIEETVNQIKELCPTLNTADKIYQVWEVLRDNQPRLNDYIDFDVFTDNIDDYVEDKIGHLTLKQ